MFLELHIKGKPVLKSTVAISLGLSLGHSLDLFLVFPLDS